MKKFLLTILVLVIVAVAAIVGLWYWQNSPPVEQNQNVNENTNQVIDTSDWKTYKTEDSDLLVIKDIRYPFSFKYPADWFVSEGGINGIGSILISSYSTEKVIRQPSNIGEAQVLFEVGYPNNDSNFIANLSIEEWCKNDLLSADIHEFKSSFDRIGELKWDQEMIDDQIVPVITYFYNGEEEMHKILCFGAVDEINILNYISFGDVNEKIYKLIISSIEFEKR